MADNRKVTQKDVQDVFNWAMSNVYVGNRNVETINYLLSQGHIDQDVLQKAFNRLVLWVDLDKLAEIHFPKEVYENSKELFNARLISEEELETIMAIRTEDGQISSFAEYLLESAAKGKGWISKERAKDFMGEQHYQDAMALMKLRQQGKTRLSRLPKDIFREVAMYDQPRIGV